MIIKHKKVYGLKLVRDYPLVPYPCRSIDEQKNIILNDKNVLKALSNALEKNVRNLREEKYNRILAEAMSGNHWAEEFIKIWKSKNIRKSWRENQNFPICYDGKTGRYLNTKGEFSKLGKNTWIFESKKEAKDYASDGYGWGCLMDLVEIVPFNSQITINNN